MTDSSLPQKDTSLIETNLGNNGGDIAFESVSDALAWVEKEIQLWTKFGGNVGSQQLKSKVLEVQLDLPMRIRDRLKQLETRDDAAGPGVIKEITGLFAQYADYRSLYSGSAAGTDILSTRTEATQLAALGGIASIVGIPGHEMLALANVNENAHLAVLSGYCMARDANVVKRSEIGRHEERLEYFLGNLRSMVTEVARAKEETVEEGNRRLEELAADQASRETSWSEFVKSADVEWTSLRTTFDVQLRLEAPANYWGKEANRAHRAAMGNLGLFAVMAFTMIYILVGHGPDFLGKLANIENGVSYASVALISLPALTALWVLRHVARLFVTNLERSNDARMRETMTATFLALTKEGASTVEQKERILVLEALFRPLGKKQTDDGQFGGLLDILGRRNGQT